MMILVQNLKRLVLDILKEGEKSIGKDVNEHFDSMARQFTSSHVDFCFQIPTTDLKKIVK